MKRIALILATPLLVVGQSASRATDKSPQATASVSSRDREQYERSMEERLRKVGRELDELKAKAGAAAERTEKEVKQQLAEAEQKEKAASRQLEKLRKESEKGWKKLSTEVNESVADLEKACAKVKSHFKE